MVACEKDESGAIFSFVADFAIGNSRVFYHTQTRSLDELMDRVREAIALCLEVKSEEAGGLEFVGVQRVSIPT